MDEIVLNELKEIKEVKELLQVVMSSQEQNENGGNYLGDTKGPAGVPGL